MKEILFLQTASKAGFPVYITDTSAAYLFFRNPWGYFMHVIITNAMLLLDLYTFFFFFLHGIKVSYRAQESLKQDINHPCTAEIRWMGVLFFIQGVYLAIS